MVLIRFLRDRKASVVPMLALLTIPRDVGGSTLLKTCASDASKYFALTNAN
jgi:hypothetical protein